MLAVEARAEQARSSRAGLGQRVLFSYHRTNFERCGPTLGQPVTSHCKFIVGPPPGCLRSVYCHPPSPSTRIDFITQPFPLTELGQGQRQKLARRSQWTKGGNTTSHEHSPEVLGILQDAYLQMKSCFGYARCGLQGLQGWCAGSSLNVELTSTPYSAVGRPSGADARLLFWERSLSDFHALSLNRKI